MPRPGISNDYIAEREDELASMVVASNHVDALRRLGMVLVEREHITETYYQDYRDSLDHIAHSLLIGRRNTARLYNGGADA